MNTILYNRENSNRFISDVLFQEKFLPKVINKLTKNPDKVIKDFYEFRKICTFFVFVHLNFWVVYI